MLLSLVRNDTAYNLRLPEKVGGQYWVTYVDEQSNPVDVIGVEGIDERKDRVAGIRLHMLEHRGLSLELSPGLSIQAASAASMSPASFSGASCGA